MRLAITAAIALGLAGTARAVPTADEVLTEMGLSASEKQKVLQGEYVTTKVGAVSDRDLSFAVAFLVKAPPEALSKQIVAGAIVTDDEQVKAYGKLSEAGSVADFAGLRVTGDEARALAAARPGDAVNLSAAEIASLKAGEVEQRLHELLLSRYRSYRSSGLAGIPAYDRGKGELSDVAADLRKATESATALQRHMPALYAVLLDYPKTSLPGSEENFFWIKSIIRDKPTYVLAQVLAAGDGDARAVVRREFYVSAGYNGEQSVSGFLPVSGGTVVLCLSHAFTDQVAGSGGSMKRSIGSKVMAGQMKDIFEKSRKRVEK